MTEHAVLNLKLLPESFYKVSLSWEINYLNNLIKLRRKMMTSNKSHAAFQRLNICEHAGT